MPILIQVCAYLASPELSARLAQVCAFQGWRINQWHTGDPKGDIAPGIPSTADIVFFDNWNQAPDLCAQVSEQTVLSFIGEVQSQAADLSRVLVLNPNWSDEEMLAQLTTALNVVRFQGQFFEEQTAEPITNLPHHPELMEYMSRHTGEPTGLVVMQIDHAEHLYANLDPVSKTDLLSALSTHLHTALPEQALMSIFDATCFVIWYPNCAEAQARELAGLLMQQSQQPLLFKNGQLHFTCSSGYDFVDNLTDPQELWQNTWAYKERARSLGGAQLQGPDEHSPVTERIPTAIKRDEFSLVLQPQWDISGTQLRGVESLLRWQGMDVGKLAPDHFIPIAERDGQMARVGDWVLERAACESATWLEHLIAPIFLGINISPQQFTNDAILTQIERLAKDKWLDPSILELEMSHNNLLKVIDQHRATLYQLRDQGVRIAIDNLGTNLVDTQKLLRCPADTLKLDRSVIARIQDDENARKLVEQICLLGQKFGLRVVAVGVEHPAQLKMLQDMGCHDAQGFLFAEPIALEKFHRYLADVHQDDTPSPRSDAR